MAIDPKFLFSLDPLLAQILGGLSQMQAQPTAIPQSLQQGAYQAPPGPLQQFQQLQQTDRYQNLSPLEQQLTNNANLRAVEDDLGMLLQQEEARKRGEAESSARQQEMQFELQKVVAPEQIRQEGETQRAALDVQKEREKQAFELELKKLTEAGLNARNTEDAATELQKAYTSGISNIIGQSDLQDVNETQQKIELFSQAYKREVAKVQLKKAIDQQRKEGKVDDDIAADIARDIASDPARLGEIGKTGLDYLKETGYKPYLPSRTSKSAPSTVAPGAQLRPRIPDAEFQKKAEGRLLRSRTEQILASIRETGGRDYSFEELPRVIEQAKKQFANMPGPTGFSFPEWFARNYFGTVDYDKVTELLRVLGAS